MYVCVIVCAVVAIAAQSVLACSEVVILTVMMLAWSQNLNDGLFSVAWRNQPFGLLILTWFVADYAGNAQAHLRLMAGWNSLLASAMQLLVQDTLATKQQVLTSKTGQSCLQGNSKPTHQITCKHLIDKDIKSFRSFQ